MLAKTKTFILDTLFPISCISCGKPDEWLCNPCLNKISLQSEQHCPICNKNITPIGRVCFNCTGKSSLDNLFVCASYKDPVLSRAIHYFKYRFVKSLGESLSKLISKSILNSEIPLPDIVIPVPLHPRRKRWRGFNQSKILAEKIISVPELNIPIREDILIRKKYTLPQMEIKNISERKNNIQNAFEFNTTAVKEVSNKNILLIDDVVTTGSTLDECSRILKRNGAKKVFSIVIAR